jgi:hypothetical protein
VVGLGVLVITRRRRLEAEAHARDVAARTGDDATEGHD